MSEQCPVLESLCSCLVALLQVLQVLFVRVDGWYWKVIFFCRVLVYLYVPKMNFGIFRRLYQLCALKRSMW